MDEMLVWLCDWESGLAGVLMIFGGSWDGFWLDLIASKYDFVEVSASVISRYFSDDVA